MDTSAVSSVAAWALDCVVADGVLEGKGTDGGVLTEIVGFVNKDVVWGAGMSSVLFVVGGDDELVV